MALCDNIRNSRKNKHLTQKQLAKKVGVSHNTISDWESGNHKPDADMIMLLCEVLEVDANYMLDIKERQAADNIKQKLKEALVENDFFDGEDLTEENFDKIVKFIGKNKEFIIDKKK